jgi:hypothetical protein
MGSDHSIDRTLSDLSGDLMGKPEQDPARGLDKCDRLLQDSPTPKDTKQVYKR